MQRVFTYGFLPILPAVAGALLLLAAPAAHAGSATPQLAQDQNAQFTEETLESYAAAASEVRALSEEWQQRLADVDDPQKTQQMRRRASEQMAKAIRAEDLSIEQYNNITRAARQNPELNSRISSHMR